MVTRRKFLKQVSQVAALGAIAPNSNYTNLFSSESFAEKAQSINLIKNLPPVKNVILIIADTLRWSHLGCYGSKAVSTKYIDEFARQSMVFDKAYTASFPTVPNRHDYLTGRYTYTYMGWAPLPQNEPTWAGTVGKSGMTSMMILDEPHIVERGFYYNRDFTGWDWIRGQEGDNLSTAPPRITPPADSTKFRGYNDAVQIHGKNIYWRQFEEDTFVAQTMQKSIHWLQRNYKSNPFFLYVDTFDPHEPWDAPQWYVDRYDPDYSGQVISYPRYWFADDFLTPSELNHCRALYAAEMTLVDRWIGKLLQAIEDMGLFKNSMIVVTTDHGFLHGEHGIMGKALIDGRDFAYCPLYEDISRIPMIIKLPDAAPFRTNAIVQPPDIMATALDLCNIQPPPGVHGKSFAGIFRDSKTTHRDFAITSPSIASNVLSARVRTALNTEDWALHLTAQQRTEKKSELKEVDGISKNAREEYGRKIDERIPYKGALYNIKNDPEQKNNLYDSKPDIVKELRNQYVAYLKELNTNPDYIKVWE